MEFAAEQWIGLALRWIHLICGIAWIGSSFYFMWLDNSLTPAKDGRSDVAGELWSVHGGGFYKSQKFLVAPSEMPDELHWFKWEAYFTWITGFLLLSLIYYLQAGTNLIDHSKLALQGWQAVAIGISSLVAGWLAYEGLCRVALRKSLMVFGIAWFAAVSVAALGLTRIFSGQGALIHVGAIIGTAMAANVFFIIIPNQRKMVRQLLRGETPDATLGLQAKQRSAHNNYMTLPLLFIMISNHFPAVFGSSLNWLWLMGISLVGVLVRHFYNLRNSGTMRPRYLVAAFVLFCAVAAGVQLSSPSRGVAAAQASVTYADVPKVLDRHCMACHALHPVHPGFTAPPAGVHFEDAETVKAKAAKIYERAVISDSMPLGNETQMTAQERQLLGTWIRDGAQIP